MYLLHCSLGGPQWNPMDVAAAQAPVHGNVGTGGAPAPSLQSGQQVWGGGQAQGWGNGASNQQIGTGGGGQIGGWQVWPGQGSEMSGGEGQPAASQQSKAQHQQQQQQHQHHQHHNGVKQQQDDQRFTLSGMPFLHGANSSLLSGNSGSSAHTVGQGELAPNRLHHQTHSIDTAG